MSRLIRVSDDLLDFMGTRTEDGRKLSYEWGKPDAEGVYEPTIMTTDDGMVVVPCDDPTHATHVRLPVVELGSAGR